MRTTRTTLLLVVALLAASLVPLANAGHGERGWGHRGTNEPDTLHDVVDNLMFEEHDTDGDASVRKVYFNGQRVILFTSYNPNLAATGSRHQTPGETTFTAMLGIWKDCDGDGYVGASEYGLQEYRSELLLSDGVCPATPPGACPPPPGGCSAGYLYPHNDGSWVRELIWIGSTANRGNGGPIAANPTYFAAPGTQLWGHYGLPGEAPATVCSITAGWSTRSTGYMMKWADCHMGYRGTATLNDVQDDTGAPVGDWDQEDIEHSPSTLNLENPAHAILYGPNGDGHPDGTGNGGLLGRDETGGSEAERAFGVWDCSNAGPSVSDPTGGALSGPITVAEPAGVPADPTNPGQPLVPPPVRDEDGNYNAGVEVFNENGERQLPTVAPSVGSPTGSYYEPANETYNVATRGECAPHGHEVPYPIAEGSRSNTNAIEGRKRADLNFVFSAGARRQEASAQLGRNWPTDLGLAPNRDLDTVGSAWRENTAILTLPQVVNRQTLEPSQALYLTFYAALGAQAISAGFQTPAGAGVTLTFGEEACSAMGPGVPDQNGWTCDPDEWEATCLEDGSAADPCAVLGQQYHLRDIDCEDGAIHRDLPVYLSSMMLPTQTPCAGPGIAP